MEALSIFKFWRNQTTEADVTSECPDVLNAIDEDEEDSFFDLVFEPSKNKYDFVESPGDLFHSKINRTSPNLKSVYKPKSFSLTLKRSPENNGDAGRGSSLRSKMLSEDRDHETTSVSRYFRLLKPLVSRKGKSTEILTPFASPVSASTRKQLTRGGRLGSFKIINVGRSSWKGRSVYPAAAAEAAGAGGGGTAALRRRDDSLLDQNDGIQGAILHCKRSFSSCSSSSSSSSSQEHSQLFRSASDPSHEKLNAPGRFSCEEQRRCSI